MCSSEYDAVANPCEHCSVFSDSLKAENVLTTWVTTTFSSEPMHLVVSLLKFYEVMTISSLLYSGETGSQNKRTSSGLSLYVK
jgi:hypothetical protein